MSSAHPLPITLTVLYTLVGSYCVFQVILLRRQKHKPFSYKIVFNAFAISWMFVRALDWSLSTTSYQLPLTALYLFFWLPHSIQYTTFATMALFLTKVIRRREWTVKFRNKFMLTWTIFGILDVVGTITLSVLAGIDDGAYSDQMDNIESLANSILFVGLCIVYM